MIAFVESSLQMEWLTLLQLLVRGALSCFDCRKTGEALSLSHQELARTKAELNSCRTTNRRAFAFGILMLLLVIVAARRG
jgi:hypothetical protein